MAYPTLLRCQTYITSLTYTTSPEVIPRLHQLRFTVLDLEPIRSFVKIAEVVSKAVLVNNSISILYFNDMSTSCMADKHVQCSWFTLHLPWSQVRYHSPCQMEVSPHYARLGGLGQARLWYGQLETVMLVYVSLSFICALLFGRSLLAPLVVPHQGNERASLLMPMRFINSLWTPSAIF